MHHQRIAVDVNLLDRLDRRRQHEALDVKRHDCELPQHEQREGRDPGREPFDGRSLHVAFPTLMWWRQACTRATKSASKVISSVRGRANGTTFDAMTRPGRELTTCTRSER